MFKEGATPIELKISCRTIIKIVAVLCGLWFLYFIRDVLAIILVALIFTAIVGPAVAWLEKKRIPRPIGVVIIYIILFSLLALVVGLLIPPLVKEIKELASNFSYLWDKIVSSLIGFREYTGTSNLAQTIEKSLTTLEGTLTKIIRSFFGTVTSIFGGLVSFVAILVITFYMIIQEDGLKKWFYNLIPHQHIPFITGILSKIQEKISLWVRGQLILCFIVGLAAYLGLAILGVKYALVLGIFAGVTEIIPYAGPFLGGTVAVLFALTISPFKAFLVVIVFVIIQQLENNILVPKVMQKIVGLNPIVSIIALLIGFRLGGIVGALLAIPVATALDIILRSVLQKNWSEGQN